MAKDMIDLTAVSSKSKKTTAAKKTSTKSKTKAKAKAKAKKTTARATYSEETISAAVRKAFSEWKKGTSLADLARKHTGGMRNPLWIQFRILAGGKEETLHRLRAAGAGMARGAYRFKAVKGASARTAVDTPSKGKKAKGKKASTK